MIFAYPISKAFGAGSVASWHNDPIPEVEPIPEVNTPWLTLKEAAQHCRCYTTTIKRAVAKGQLKGPVKEAGKRRRWVFNRNDLDQWNEGHKPQAKRSGPGRRPKPVYKHFNFE